MGSLSIGNDSRENYDDQKKDWKKQTSSAPVSLSYLQKAPVSLMSYISLFWAPKSKIWAPEIFNDSNELQTARILLSFFEPTKAQFGLFWVLYSQKAIRVHLVTLVSLKNFVDFFKESVISSSSPWLAP